MTPNTIARRRLGPEQAGERGVRLARSASAFALGGGPAGRRLPPSRRLQE
jgi:hypothetical protein